MIQFLKRAALSVKAAKAGYVRIFADETGALALKDAAGSVTPIGGGADGLSAYEVAVANGFVGNEAAWLASLVGADGAGLASGTSFPGSPSTGDRFWRSDRHVEYFYDGTRWLSSQLFTMEFADGGNPISSTNSKRSALPWAGTYSIYAERLTVATFNTTSTASNYYSFRLQSGDGASANTDYGSGLSCQNDTINSWVSRFENINSVIASAIEEMHLSMTRVGSATVYVTASLVYRLVG